MSSPAQRTPTAGSGPSRSESLRARLGRWRNLRLPVKLAMVMAVPVVVGIVLGLVLINGQLGTADQYARANRLTELSGVVRGAISAIQDERQLAATPDHPTAALAGARQRTDTALNTARTAVGADQNAGDLDQTATAAWHTAARQLATLPNLRTARSDPSTQVAELTQLVDALFAFDRVLATGQADARLTQQALALYDLFAAREEVRYQEAVVLAGIGTGTMSVPDVTALHGSSARLASRISDFRAVASQDVADRFDAAVSGVALSAQDSLLGQAIDQSGGMSGHVMPGMMIRISPADWTAANTSVTAGLDRVTGQLADQLLADSTALRGQAGSAAGSATVALIITLVVAIVVMVLVARQLLGSIGLLRRSARDVATRALPDAVNRIMAGETVEPTVPPVGVHTSDEVGQLARAFDAVHAEALRLAVEQANLRANYSELFVNLSRRSQSLVQRQLKLIEQLERDEEDPDQLGALFKLDHLATRMRRNNENLMVLSGSELGRGPSQPVALADLLRAAVSEIEHYQRVVVQPPPDAHIAGYAAGDLVRLLAELLDNATAFSAPDTPVTVASHRTRRRALVIDIVDHGIGMGDEELRAANEQLDRPAGVEGRMSRRMGLFVISRLANQHGVRVRLHGGQDIPGLRVTITVPVELVIGGVEISGVNQFPPIDGPGGAGGPQTPLPRRVAGAARTPGHRAGTAPRAGSTTVVGAPADQPTQAQAQPETPVIPEPAAAELTVTIPALPPAEASGVSLFAPLSTSDDVDPLGPAETTVTPIYDDMVSAWFHEAPASPTQSAAPESAEAWRFAADAGWQAVDAVAVAEPAEYTSAGLPKRQPRARLLPGQVALTEELIRATTVPADRLRDRLSGFQRGVQLGRRACVGEPPVAPIELTEAWVSSADEGWRAADAVASAPTAPGELTTAGLPRRQPRARLLPGSVAPPEKSAPEHAVPAGRNADALRDRLNSFQRGVRQGRGGQQATEPDRVDHGFQW